MDEETENHNPDSLIFKYFSRGNFLCKNVISEQRSLSKFLGDRWQEIDFCRKDALLDLLFVEDDVRQLVDPSKAEESVQESFPRLYINSGQKINVDFDLWTWRDEHSGPFSWMSRSQQDLTLADLEPETISKPQPKILRVDTDNPDSLKEAEQQFSFPSNCWSRDIIDDYRKAERHITLSPCTSMEFSVSRSGHPSEEVNQVFEENQQQEAQSMSQSTHESHKDDGRDASEDLLNNGNNDILLKRKNSGKERKRRSPSPKKILRSSSLRRSPSKSSDQGEQQLISRSSDDNYEEHNSFSNPVVETEWSSFIGEDGNSNAAVEDVSDHPHQVMGLPPSQVIDRGADLVAVSSSPYQVQRDSVHLISPNDSPAQKAPGDKMYTVTNNLEGWSAESTPDHTTHLLKGVQSNETKRPDTSYQFSTEASGGLDKYEEEEILTVASQGKDITITTEPENKRDSDIPTTGFDFLDNW